MIAERRGSGNVGWTMVGHGPATTASGNEMPINGMIEPSVSQQPPQPYSSRTTLPSYPQGGVPPAGGTYYLLYTVHTRTQYSVIRRTLTASLLTRQSRFQVCQAASMHALIGWPWNGSCGQIWVMLQFLNRRFRVSKSNHGPTVRDLAFISNKLCCTNATEPSRPKHCTSTCGVLV